MHQRITLDYEPSRGEFDRVTVLRLSVTFVILLALSGLVVVCGANESPYRHPVVFHQALVQVGLGSLLIVCWTLWSIVLLKRASQNRISRYVVALSAIPAIASFYLFVSVTGYIEEASTGGLVPAPQQTNQPPTVPAAAPALVPTTARSDTEQF